MTPAQQAAAEAQRKQREERAADARQRGGAQGAFLERLRMRKETEAKIVAVEAGGGGMEIDAGPGSSE